MSVYNNIKSDFEKSNFEKLLEKSRGTQRKWPGIERVKRFSNAKNLFNAEPLIAFPSTRNGYNSSGSRESLTLNLFPPSALDINFALS